MNNFKTFQTKLIKSIIEAYQVLILDEFFYNFYHLRRF